MNVTIEKNGNVNAVITVSLEEKDYQDKVTKDLKTIGLKHRIDGFRPGKVPAGILKKMFGKQVLADVVNRETVDALFNFIKENNLSVLGEPLAEESQEVDLSQKEYTFKLQMKDGENKISISAYADALKSDYQNTFTKENTNTNTSAPTIKVLKDSNQIIINVKDESNITKIIYNFNGQEKTIDNINQKEYQLKLDLIDGTNYVIVNAYNQNNKSEYKGKTTK